MNQKTVVLGITGGIAAVTIPDLIAQLRSKDIRVIPIMTTHATHIISPDIIKKAADSPVYTELFPKNYSTQTILKKRSVDHITIAESADLIVIAPATANILAKLAHGIADDFLTTTLLATRARILLCPSMNSNMWSHPSVQKNIDIVHKRGCIILPPDSGDLACGYKGQGRLPTSTTISNQISLLLNKRTILKNKKVLITSGGTKEPIDDVRFITNNSSGTMGAALAEACTQFGATVTYVHANDAKLPRLQTIRYSFTTAQELSNLLITHMPSHDIIFHLAAVSDFTVKKVSRKISSKKSHILQLIPTKKIYSHIKEINPDIHLITFKAEPSMSPQAWNTTLASVLETTPIDTVIGNPIDKLNQGFSSDWNEVYIRTKHGKSLHLPRTTKINLAFQIIDFLFSN